MNGIFLSNIINFDSEARNIEMRELVARAVRTICHDLGEFQLLVQNAPWPCSTRVGHLRFDDWNVNVVAVRRLNGLPIWLGAEKRKLIARLNQRSLPAHVAARYSQYSSACRDR